MDQIQQFSPTFLNLLILNALLRQFCISTSFMEANHFFHDLKIHPNRKIGRHTYCDFKQIVPFYSSLLVQHLHSPLLNMLPFILSRPSSASWRWDCVSLLELVEPDYWPGDSEIGTNCGENKDHPARHLPQLRSLQSLQAKAACFPLAGGKAILVSVRMIQRNL